MADRFRQNLISAHQEWLGFVQPVGLVLAPTVMADAQVVPDRNISGRQRAFRALLESNGGATVNLGTTVDSATDLTGKAQRDNIVRLFRDWLGWEEGDLVDGSLHRETLEVALPELQVILAPTWAVPAGNSASTDWAMLVRVEEGDSDLDRPPDDGSGWNASRHARFERLLRETGVQTGLICTNEQVRLVHSPPGESSGHITFDFAQMASPAGRPILAAFDMLLSADALFGGVPDARLPTLLSNSRDAQAEVSARLSRQVLGALHELLRGFVAADKQGGRTAVGLAQSDPDHLYGGLVTTLMRLVFVLYAEDRGLMPSHPVYEQHYSLGGLFARLRADAAAWPDTMDQRFGAWAQLLALFRLIHGGGSHGALSFVARRGALFDPDRFPFLEGSSKNSIPATPMVPDATIWNVLRLLMVLDGERLSYRTLDVEQIGSVYEAVMGFRVELTTGRSIAVTSSKRTGTAVTVDIDAILKLDGGKRAKLLRELTDRNVAGTAAASSLRSASNVEDVVAALDRVVDRNVTPDVVAFGTPILQPTDARRRSGSHYTPRSLTEPIVSEALRPILERMGPNARPAEILDLKVLDPATGSGAFLVEACRQISARLVDAWSVHGGPSGLPADEDELLHARRLVAQRCLYGVDRNPMAIDLAKLSIWLVTLARDHEFTFIDHALRHGDSLVGLTRNQIEGFHWDVDAPSFQFGAESPELQQHVARVAELRHSIRELGDEAPEQELRGLLDEADRELRTVCDIGDLVLTAFFSGDSSKDRESLRGSYATMLLDRKDAVNADSAPPPPTPFQLAAFHWELEFSEVFERENPGFDAVVGNPPFAGKNTLAAGHPAAYPAWLRQLHAESHGNADLAAHFFRRTFGLVRDGGTLGLVATNTIRQGDTRSTGLRWICHHGGEIYRAQRRLKWPGEAAVVVSVVHIIKGRYSGPRLLDGHTRERITAFLFHDGGHDDPDRLKANAGQSFQGTIVLGMGFTFDDTDKKGIATPLAEMRRLLAENPRNKEAIDPYIGGAEVNGSPTHAHHRYVINFREWPLRRADLGATWHDAEQAQRREWLRDGFMPLDYPEPVAADWSDLLSIVQEQAKPQRDKLPQDSSINREAKRKWWRFRSYAKTMYSAIEALDRVLTISCGATPHAAVTFLPGGMVYANSLAVFALDSYSAYCALQSRPHELWARFFGSSMKDDLRYTPSDCFETFPFPENWGIHAPFEEAGAAYFEFRAALMMETSDGMTKTYNRFHDPEDNDPRIAQLRKLHDAMDRAVLDSYGWDDIPTDCEFLLDYEIDEEAWGRKKRPWRYRWPDAVGDEVLSRLLVLNTQRASEEREHGT